MKLFNSNRNYSYFIILFLFSYFSINSLRAQVTIGSGLEPNKGSLLQLKENEDVSGGENSHKGFNLPRVNITDGNNLYPMFLKDPENPALGPTDEYAANKDAIDKTHTGLLVYNINETAGFLKGLYIWKGDHWVYSDGISPWYAVDTQTSADHNTDEVYLNGTVTIGKSITEAENANGALLQLAENVKTTKSLKPQHNAYRGLVLPRVKLTDKSELYPMFLTNPELPFDETVPVTDTKYNPEKDEYKNGKAALKASHTGLIIYNMTEDPAKGLSVGLNQWDGTQWRRLGVAQTNWFYMPSIAIDVTTSGTFTRDLYLEYRKQFEDTQDSQIPADSPVAGSPLVKSSGAPDKFTEIIEDPTKLHYYVTGYDQVTFSNIAISADGKLTYTVNADNVTEATYMNIVFVEKY